MESILKLYAGKTALSIIRDEGLRPERIKVLAGAAGGPKWLILSRLDRFIIPEFLKEHSGPVFLLGASIGAWRFAALSQKEPTKAIEKFENAYINQRYSSDPPPSEVSGQSRRIMESYLEDAAIEDILTHPVMRLNILAVRSRGILADDRKRYLIPGFGAAAVMNAFSRSFLSLFFKRTLFVHPETPEGFPAGDRFKTERVPLTKDNFRKALLSSGSIPLVMEGVTNISGAPPGAYRDGGILDYHLDIPYLKDDDGVVLFPHYTDRIIPGWFDKIHSRRKPNPVNMDRVIMAAPSKDFVKKLPYGKIADRKDFYKFKGDDKGRIDYWNCVAAESKRLKDAFADAVLSGRIRDMIEPTPF